LENVEEVCENLDFGEKRFAAKVWYSDARKMPGATSVVIKWPSLQLPKPFDAAPPRGGVKSRTKKIQAAFQADPPDTSGSCFHAKTWLPDASLSAFSFCRRSFTHVITMLVAARSLFTDGSGTATDAAETASRFNILIFRLLISMSAFRNGATSTCLACSFRTGRL
jgi:hypothetical protein